MFKDKEVYREGEMSCDIPSMWNLKRNDTNELTGKPERDSQTQENEMMAAKGKDS